MSVISEWIIEETAERFEHIRDALRNTRRGIVETLKADACDAGDREVARPLIAQIDRALDILMDSKR